MCMCMDPEDHDRGCFVCERSLYGISCRTVYYDCTEERVCDTTSCVRAGVIKLRTQVELQFTMDHTQALREEDHEKVIDLQRTLDADNNCTLWTYQRKGENHNEITNS